MIRFYAPLAFLAIFSDVGALHAQTHGSTTTSTTRVAALYSTAAISLIWDANPAHEQVKDYEISWSLNDDAFRKVNSDDPAEAREGEKMLENLSSTGGAITKSFTNLPNDKLVHFGVRAVNDHGKSKFARFSTITEPYVPNEPPPPTIQDFKVTDANGRRNVSLNLVGGLEGKKYTVQISEDLKNWTDVSSVVMDDSGEPVNFPFQWPLSSAPKQMFFRFKYMK